MSRALNTIRRALWRLAFDTRPADDNPGDLKWRMNSRAVRIAADAVFAAQNDPQFLAAERVRAARIIDPEAWTMADACPVAGGDVWIAPSLAKADLILGLPATKA